MKSNMIIHPKDEKNSKIDVYGIEKHFTTFHKFRSSTTESEYVCEF